VPARLERIGVDLIDGELKELGLFERAWFKSAFIAYDASYAIDIDIDSGNPGILHRSLPVATREFFPPAC